MNEVDLTVIGGGPTGLFAAFYGGLRGMSVRIIDSLPELGGQMRALYPDKNIYDMPGFPKVLGGDLADRLIEQAMQFSPELLLGETAKNLAKTEAGYSIRTESGLDCPTKTIVLTSGAGAFSPTRMGVEDEQCFEGRGVYYGVQELDRFRNKKLVVVGGGNSACDWALHLEEVADEVTLVHRRDVFRAHEDTVEKLHGSGIHVRLWSVVTALHGNGHLQGITVEDTRTQETETLATDALIVNIGFKSALGHLRDWGLEIDKNHVVVDNHYHTNLPGIYAAGDVCTYPGKLKLIATGVGEAATAVCYAKVFVDPSAHLYPGHSSDRDRPSRSAPDAP
jgi:thioredoxin reductase (NADPH)